MADPRGPLPIKQVKQAGGDGSYFFGPIRETSLPARVDGPPSHHVGACPKHHAGDRAGRVSSTTLPDVVSGRVPGCPRAPFPGPKAPNANAPSGPRLTGRSGPRNYHPGNSVSLRSRVPDFLFGARNHGLPMRVGGAGPKPEKGCSRFPRKFRSPCRAFPFSGVYFTRSCKTVFRW